ncbi:MAG: HD domain-containing protein [Culicoidibacterales bacterium]
MQLIDVQKLQDGTTVENQACLLSSLTHGTANNGQLYLNLELQDSTGTLNAKLWQANQEILQQIAALVGTVIEATFVKNTYRNQTQLKVLKIQAATNVAMEQFIEQAPMAPEAMQLEVAQYVATIQDQTTARVIQSLMTKYHDQFYKFPAASKNHHDYMGGLAFHTLCMLRLAEQLHGLYPILNRDYLYAGVLLHDLGKVIELSGPIATEYTIKGKLLGHITIMVSEIELVAQQLGLVSETEQEIIMILQHLVLSHHGKLEFGSPKVPMMMEAEMLHYLDNIDAKMMMMERALQGVEPGTFSQRVFALENRQLYKPNHMPTDF